MKNAFVETYKAVKTLATRIEAATTEEEKNSIRKECEDVTTWIDEQGKDACYIWHSCERSLDNGNIAINLNTNAASDSLIECLRKNGVSEFTFSSGWSGAIESVWFFQQNGCTLAGMIEVNGDRLPLSKEHEKMPAFLFKLN